MRQNIDRSEPEPLEAGDVDMIAIENNHGDLVYSLFELGNDEAFITAAPDAVEPVPC